MEERIMNSVNIVIPSFRSPALAYSTIQAYENFSNGFKFYYTIVENSNDSSHREILESLNDRVTWIQNDVDFSQEKYPASFAVASAFEKGINENKNGDFIFFSHNDISPARSDWLSFFFKRYDDGNRIVSAMRDNSRIKAPHTCALLTDREFVTDLSLFPVMVDGEMTHDVGDTISQKCRDLGFGEYVFRNTHNDGEVNSLISDSDFVNFDVVKSINKNNDVIIMHLARGTTKYHGQYRKSGGERLPAWVNFLKSKLGADLSGLL